eukprot:2934863-Rhodomonas_salina.1
MRFPQLLLLAVIAWVASPCSAWVVAPVLPRMCAPQVDRRTVFQGLVGAGLGGFSIPFPSFGKNKSGPGPTNEIVGVKDGIRQKRLGGSGIVVSEVRTAWMDPKHGRVETNLGGTCRWAWAPKDGSQQTSMRQMRQSVFE